MPAGLANPVATLARCLLSLMPTEHDSPVASEITVRICSASSAGSSTSAPRVRLVPTPHLERMAQVAQQCHHLFRRRVVRRGIRRQKRRVRTASGRGAQRHARVHTELAGLIRRAGHHLAGFGRVAATPDDDRQPDQFGMAPQFHRGQELVEVDVQDPAWLHRPQSLRARLSHASPSACRDMIECHQLVLDVVGLQQGQSAHRSGHPDRRSCRPRPAASGRGCVAPSPAAP